MGIANLGVKMMDIKAWISNPKVIANSKKGYAHFDLRTDITKVSEYISNPEKVARHSFYPFIHYVMRMDKYNKKTGVKPKTRVSSLKREKSVMQLIWIVVFINITVQY